MLRKTLFILGILFYILFILALAFGIRIASDLLVIGTAVTLAAYLLVSGPELRYRRNGTILVSLAIMAHTAADGIWSFVEQNLHQDPAANPVIIAIYMIPNVILLAAGVRDFFRNRRLIHPIKLTLDICFILIISTLFFYHILIRLSELRTIAANEFFYLLAFFVVDLLLLIVAVIGFLTTRTKPRRLPDIFIGLAALLVVSRDILFFVSTFYPPLSWLTIPHLDLIWLTTVFLFAIAVHVSLVRPSDIVPLKPEDRQYENLSVFSSAWFFFALTILLYLMKILTSGVVLQSFVLIILFQLVSYYLQRNIISGDQLEQQKQMSEILDRKVQMRTNELTRLNQELIEQSITDPLTGIHNRTHFLNQIDQRIAEGHTPFAVMMLDLDRFKVINDLHGHYMGDLALIEISRRLSPLSSERCLVARIGGDEFGLIFESIDTEEISRLADQIHDLFEEQIAIDDFRFYLDVSIGIACYPIIAETRDQLMQYADVALYLAKRQVLPRKTMIYSSILSARTERNNQIEVLLRNAVYDDVFELRYQPQFSAADRRLTGVEALLRWHSSLLGDISPTDFIPIAEESGQIVPVTNWVIEQALRQIKAWNTRTGLNLRMSINLSPAVLNYIHFYDTLADLIAKLNIPSEWILFELTERMSMMAGAEFAEAISRLRSMGIGSSIDDFGTGYSSFYYLRVYAINQLKIAKELIDQVAGRAAERSIVEAILVMARGLGLETVAEGVEKQVQVEVLRQMGCDHIQGYLWGMPVKADEFERRYLSGQTDAMPED